MLFLKRVWGLGFSVQGLGFPLRGYYNLGFRLEAYGCRVSASRFNTGDLAKSEWAFGIDIILLLYRLLT